MLQEAESLKLQAEAELERRRRRRRALPLAEFVADVATKHAPYAAPNHLAPLVELLEAARHRPVRSLSSVPPRHGKTETILHNIALDLLIDPTLRIAYITYAVEIACEKSRRAQEIAARAGVKLSRTQTAVSHWKTAEGGSLFATGVGGQLTSLGFDRIYFDDPHKNRAEAESSLYRQRVHDFFTSTAMSRLEPGGSAFVNHTRWHPDDLIGRLVATDKGKNRWKYVNLPAVSDDGKTALWPERWPVPLLLDRKEDVGEYDWNSLYLGRPRVRGGTVFKDVHFYEDKDLPRGMRVAIGVDFAYTAKTSSDWSVAVVIGEADGIFYVLHVIRKQCTPTAFAADLQGLQRTYPGAPMYSYTGGTEAGTVDFLNNDYDIQIITKPALVDKFQRSLPSAAKWNAKKILVPKDGPAWVSPYVGEILDFTGVKDANDDQVDATAPAVDALSEGAFVDTETLIGGSRRW